MLATRMEWMLLSNAARARGLPVPSASATVVLDAAAKQGVNLVVLRAGSAGVRGLAGITAPDSVKAELAADLAGGQTLVVPSRLVMVDGHSSLAWWRLDSASAVPIGVLPGERGQAMTEYIEFLEQVNAILCELGTFKHYQEVTNIGALAVGLANCALIAYTGGAAEEAGVWRLVDDQKFFWSMGVLEEIGNIGLEQVTTPSGG